MGSHNHHHSHGHNHSHGNTKNLTFAFWINTAFAILELVGGLYINSVAILSDSLHDFGDSLSLGLAYYFHKKSTKKRDEHFSYGYKRFSLLGAFINSIVLIVGSILIIRESVGRIIHPEQADPKGMLVLAIIGVAVNTIAMLRLKKGKSINERVVSLHFIEDILGWVAVLAGSIIMLLVDLPVIDPILSLLIAFFILFNVYKNLRQVFQIILQGIPENVNINEIKRNILSIPQVLGIHDIHTWSMDGEFNIMSIHIVLADKTTTEEVEKIKQEVRHSTQHLNIQHITIEPEFENQHCQLEHC